LIAASESGREQHFGNIHHQFYVKVPKKWIVVQWRIEYILNDVTITSSFVITCANREVYFVIFQLLYDEKEQPWFSG